MASISYSDFQPSSEVCPHNWSVRSDRHLQPSEGSPTDTASRVSSHDSLASDPQQSDPTARGRNGTRDARTIANLLTDPLKRLMGDSPVIVDLYRLYHELNLRRSDLLSGSLRLWIKNFAPDVCLSMLNSGGMSCLAIRVADFARAPLVPYIQDDWPMGLHSHNGIFSGTLRRSMHKWVTRAITRAPIRIVISQQMEDEYSIRYGGRFHTIANCVDASRYSMSPPLICGSAPRIVRFVFTGNLYLDRSDSMLRIGESLARLRHRGLNGEALIFTSPGQQKAFAAKLSIPGVMRFMEWVPPEQLPSVLQAADVLLHIDAHGSKQHPWLRLSFGAKLPEYLMAGRPILSYMPADFAGAEYVARWKAGLVVGTTDESSLDEAMARLIVDERLRSELGANGLKVALSRHEAGKVREDLRRLLAQGSERISTDRGGY